MSSARKRLVLTILICIHTQCMNPMRKLLLRSTTIGCSSFYYLLTAGPSALIYLSLSLSNADDYVKKLKEPSELEKQFVHEQLQNAGVLNHHLLSVKIDPESGYGVHSLYHLISIDPYVTEPNPNNLLSPVGLVEIVFIVSLKSKSDCKAQVFFLYY